MKPLTFCGLLLLTTLVKADVKPISDGNALSEGLRPLNKAIGGGKLTANEETTAMVTASYVDGFFRACGLWQVYSSNVPFKLPKEGVTQPQFIKIVDKYLNDHPERLHEQATLLLFLALRDNFPNPAYVQPNPSDEK